MVGLSRYISQRVWRNIDPQLRRAIMRVTGLNRNVIVSKMQIGNLHHMLLTLGEHELANMLKNDEPLGVLRLCVKSR